MLLHKPAGVVTTARDPQGRQTVVDLVTHDVRVVPVGRLDADTTGALLLTNDGPLAHRLAHPRYGVEKTYVAEVDGTPSDETIRRLADGVELEDGRTAPRAFAASGRRASSWCSTRGATARCGECARPSATPCAGCTALATPASTSRASSPASGVSSRAVKVASRLPAFHGVTNPIRSYMAASVGADATRAFSAPCLGRRAAPPRLPGAPGSAPGPASSSRPRPRRRPP